MEMFALFKHFQANLHRCLGVHFTKSATVCCTEEAAMQHVQSTHTVQHTYTISPDTHAVQHTPQITRQTHSTTHTTDHNENTQHSTGHTAQDTQQGHAHIHTGSLL